MTRRGLVIVLHWSVLMLVLAMVKGGTASEAVRWAFVAAGGLWVAMTVLRGMLGRPGPKLQGAARAAYRPMHLGLYTLLAGCVAINGAELLHLIQPGWGWNALLVLLTAATFHGLFHFWRHTALYDGAFRVMMPRALHKYL